jgi:hypothetical protein
MLGIVYAKLLALFPSLDRCVAIVQLMTIPKKISFFKPNEFLAADNEIFGMELQESKTRI